MIQNLLPRGRKDTRSVAAWQKALEKTPRPKQGYEQPRASPSTPREDYGAPQKQCLSPNLLMPSDAATLLRRTMSLVDSRGAPLGPNAADYKHLVQRS